MKKIYLFSTLLLSIITVQAQENSAVTGKKPHFVISADVNYAYRLGETPDGLPAVLEDYTQDLKSGVSFGVGFYYKFNDFLGAGFKYNTYRSKASLNGIYAMAPNGDEGYTRIEDNVAISFYGPAFLFDKKMGIGYLTAEAAIGYMEYRNKTYILGDYKYTGQTLGFIAGVSYNFELFENFSAGPRLNIVAGSITELELTGPEGYKRTFDRDGDDAESMWRFDAGVYLTYRF